MRYYLMNKDRVAACLEIDCGHIAEVEQEDEYLPYGFGTGLSWIDSRAVAGERSFFDTVCALLGIDDASSKVDWESVNARLNRRFQRPGDDGKKACSQRRLEMSLALRGR